MQPKDSIWFILSNEWFAKWKAYVNFDANPDEEELDWSATAPGPIDNSSILLDSQDSDFIPDPREAHENILLKKDLKEQTDYHVLSQELWKLFLDAHGILKENPANGNQMNHEVVRKAIELDETTGASIVEVNLRPVKVFPLPNHKYLRLTRPVFV